MTNLENASVAANPAAGRHPQVAGAAPLSFPPELEKARAEAYRLLDGLGALVGPGVTPVLRGIVDMLYGQGIAASIEAATWLEQARSHDRLIHEILDDKREADRLLEQARGIACHLEGELTETVRRYTALVESMGGVPVLVDFALAPVQIEFRDRDGETLARATFTDFGGAGYDDLSGVEFIAVGPSVAPVDPNVAAADEAVLDAAYDDETGPTTVELVTGDGGTSPPLRMAVPGPPEPPWPPAHRPVGSAERLLPPTVGQFLEDNMRDRERRSPLRGLLRRRVPDANADYQSVTYAIDDDGTC